MGRFEYKLFSDVDLSDSFFDSLKKDYPGTENSAEFCSWFRRKAAENARAYVYEKNSRIGAFVYLKEEDDYIQLKNRAPLPKKRRIKLGTLKISDLNRGQRIGEGSMGLVLWYWQKSQLDEIYVTVFQKQDTLIQLIEKFGFVYCGDNLNNERVYIKDRRNISYITPYSSFPFINPDFKYAGYLIFEDYYHDEMFTYSKLASGPQYSANLDVANGLSKIYVSSAPNIKFSVGEPILIYRKYNGDGIKKYKSCVTSIGVVSRIFRVKNAGKCLVPIEEVLCQIGNKSVFDQDDLINQYKTKYNLSVYEFLYYAYFGPGNNVNYAWLKEHNLWADNCYPMDMKLNQEQLEMILTEGGLDVENIIIS